MNSFLPIAHLFFLLFNFSIWCQEYTHCVSYVQSVAIQPLSEQGRKLFEKKVSTTVSVQESQNQYSGNFHTNGGQLSVSRGIGNYNAMASADLLSIFAVIPVLARWVCRMVDINGHYYKQDMQDMYEQILYDVDKARYEIYENEYQSNAYCRDIEYLQTKIYELEICVIACGGKKSAVCRASRDARDTLVRVLGYVESCCNHIPHEKCKIRCVTLQHVLETIRTTKFKNKKKKRKLYDEYQARLADEERRYRAYQAAIAAQQIHERELQKQRHIEQVFTEQLPLLEDAMKDSAWYATQVPMMVDVYEQRTEVLHQSGEYCTKTYLVNDSVHALLKNYDVRPDAIATCYGNQYQQRLQQESFAILEHTSQALACSVIYPYQHTIVAFVEVAVDYNHVGKCHKAVPLMDFCWTLLSWGSQIVEGVVAGAAAGAVNAAVTDIIEHPIETGASLVLGSSVMLTYQLSKIIYAIADLGITTWVNPIAGKEKWEQYLEPINQLLDAIDKKQIGLKETSKAVMQFGVRLYTQAKLFGGLRTFYEGIKNKAGLFFRNTESVVLQQYLATPDGQLCKAAIYAMEQPMHACPASCINQYERLKEALMIEQFTSIIKTTKHGIQRLIERGFTVQEVEDLVYRPHYVRAQFDAAKVFITNLSSDKYNLLVINERIEEVVTALRNISFNRVEKLGNNYGWSLKE